MYLLIMVIDMDVMLLRDLLHDVQAGKIGIEAALYLRLYMDLAKRQRIS